MFGRAMFAACTIELPVAVTAAVMLEATLALRKLRRDCVIFELS
jgi:hypothetical protein